MKIFIFTFIQQMNTIMKLVEIFCNAPYGTLQNGTQDTGHAIHSSPVHRRGEAIRSATTDPPLPQFGVMVSLSFLRPAPVSC